MCIPRIGGCSEGIPSDGLHFGIGDGILAQTGQRRWRRTVRAQRLVVRRFRHFATRRRSRSYSRRRHRTRAAAAAAAAQRTQHFTGENVRQVRKGRKRFAAGHHHSRARRLIAVRPAIVNVFISWLIYHQISFIIEFNIIWFITAFNLILAIYYLFKKNCSGKSTQKGSVFWGSNVH